MSERFHTTIEWQGNRNVADRLIEQIPDTVSYTVEENSDYVKLSILVDADDMKLLREDVDRLLTLFSDYDE
tara:strand:- start:3273 stop:3485 length:213 start_codon:yes stop_codon:yes gene_type:complete